MARSTRTALFAMALTVVVGAVGPLASTVQAAEPPVQQCLNNTGPTYGAWSAQQHYDYGRGGWCMQTGEYRLVFQTDGNFVVYKNRTANNPAHAKWASNTAGVGTQLAFQRDGNIVIYSYGTAVWSTIWSPDWQDTRYWRFTFKNTLGAGHVLHVQQFEPFRTVWVSSTFY